MSGRLRFRVVTVVLIGTFAGTLSAQDKEPTPVRRNPNIDRPITNENFDSAVVNLLQQLVAAYGPIANSNDRPTRTRASSRSESRRREMAASGPP